MLKNVFEIAPALCKRLPLAFYPSRIARLRSTMVCWNLLLSCFLIGTIGATKFVVQLVSDIPMDLVLAQYSLSGSAETYKFGKDFRSFSGEFDEGLIQKLYDDPRIASISIDRDIEIQEYVLQGNAPQHLLRLSSSSPTTHQPYIYHSNAGIGVDVYIFDTGIDSKNPNLQNLNVLKLNDLTNNVVPEGVDPQGHGSAMAGVVASETFGVLKKCNLIDLRSVENSGFSSLSTLLKAMSIAEEHFRITERPSVFIIPMIMTKNSILNSALENLSKKIAVIVPAGNQGLDACNFSPSSCQNKSNVLVVGSLDKSDELAPFTNYGSCVDVFTSGTEVTTLSPTDLSQRSLITQVNGTSVSCAIGGGVVGYYMSLGLNSSEAIQKVKDVSYYHDEIKKDYKVLQLKL